MVITLEKNFDRKLVLEDGTEYLGYAFGDTNTEAICELVFNTCMVGYQEILSDPSYTSQMVVMTYPLIGNYGISDDDYESKTPTIGGLIVREYNDLPSNFRSTKTLGEVMEENRIPGIFGVDTRAITRHIREKGTMRAMMTSMDTTVMQALEKISNTPEKHDAVSIVSSKKRWYARTSNPKYNVVVVDCGVRQSLIKSLNAKGCNVTVVPYNTDMDAIESMHPNGIFLSNGPGNPEDLPELVALVGKLRGKYPIFGVDLGHELICLAYGAKVSKLKFGHRGSNHPVKNLLTGTIEVCPQNHSYVVDAESLKATDLTVTHVNLLDNTVEGVKCEKDKVFSVQYVPEIALGPKDTQNLFDMFIDTMKGEPENA